MGDIAQIEQLQCSEMSAHGGSHFVCVCVCACVTPVLGDTGHKES